jgi:hypothetical protein
MPTISAHEYPLAKIFSDDYAFRIPDYQRPYRWTEEQAEQLLQDITDAVEDASRIMDRRDAKDLISPYFLGSIVLIKAGTGPEVDVVDGQQRLTTLSLLLAALRALLGPEHSATLSGMLFEKGSALRGTQDRCRLTLRQADHGFFQRYILEDDELQRVRSESSAESEEAQQNLRGNCHYFLKQLGKRDVGQLQHLAIYLLQHTYLVTVETSSLDSAFRIFSVLNDRGLDLGTADLLKADIIGQIPEQKRSEYNAKWEETEKKLKSDLFERLFTHIVMIHLKRKSRESTKKAFDIEVKAKQRPMQFIDEELLPYAEAYEILVTEDWEGDANYARGINRSLKRLGRIDNKDWVPPALVLLRRCQSQPAGLEQSLQLLERLAMVLWLTRYTPTERIDRYAELLKALEGSDKPELCAQFQPTEEELNTSSAVLHGDIYNLSPNKKRTAILLRLDEAMGSEEAEYAESTITVEHVLPKTPAGQWLEWWPEKHEREAATHVIGNLALLNRRQNSAARNWDFETKKKRYFTTKAKACPFRLTNEVLLHQEWTPKIVKERQQRFTKMLCEAWQLPET